MNTLSQNMKSFLIVFLFAFVTGLAGCTADSLTGVQNEESQAEQADCDKDCPNPHNL